MSRRRSAVAALGAVATVAFALLPGVPAAAADGVVTSPAPDTTVSDVVPVRVSVQRDPGEGISSVEARLLRDGATLGGTSLSCQSGCNAPTGDQTWGGVSLDPRAPRAFGSSSPLANGTYRIEASVNGDAYQGGSRFVVSTPASPVAGLAARVEDRTIRLGWQLPPEPDVTGHVVERRRDGGSWSRVSSLGPKATSYTDTVERSGTYTYRVFTSRPDGRGGQLTAVSAPADAEVGVPSGSPGPDEGGSSPSSDGSTGDTSDGSTSDGDRSTDGTGTDAQDGADEGGRTAAPSTEDEDGEDGQATSDDERTSSRASGVSRRVASPPGVRRGVKLSTESLDMGEGEGADPQVAPERHYGDDQEFSEELDYGDVDPVTGEPRRVVETQQEVVRRPLALFADADGGTTRATLLSIAAGLLFITIGLHLFRWMRET